jgi:uncharacterized integral membrane protein
MVRFEAKPWMHSIAGLLSVGTVSEFVENSTTMLLSKLVLLLLLLLLLARTGLTRMQLPAPQPVPVGLELMGAVWVESWLAAVACVAKKRKQRNPSNCETRSCMLDDTAVVCLRCLMMALFTATCLILIIDLGYQ